jgi:hypothetical protein
MSYRTNAPRFVIGRESNVVRVDFRRKPDPPAPLFPGAGALRMAPANDDISRHKDAVAAGASGLTGTTPAR